MRRALAALVPSVAAAAILVGFAPAAHAVPPTRTTFILEGTDPLADCGSFTVLDHYYVEVDQTNYFDQDGNRVEIHQAIHGTDTYINSVTGEAITMGSNFMVHYDPQTMLNMSAGMIYHLIVPGLGNVFVEVGRSVYDVAAGEFVVLNGPHQLAEGDVSGLCSAFQ